MKCLYFLMIYVAVLSLVGCGSPYALEEVHSDFDTTHTTDTAPDEERDPESWQWLEVSGSVCGNGSQTGLGVRAAPQSEDALIFFDGGGACWDMESCFVLKSAEHLEYGYDAEHFESEPDRELYLFDREDAENPFRAASHVFIPYCTGDFHNGNRVTSYDVLFGRQDVHHQGAQNVELGLQALTPMLKNKKRIFLVGMSAGGYGAQFHYARFRRAFPDAEVHLLADSAPLMQPRLDRLIPMQRAWNFQHPEACELCVKSFPAWLLYLRDTFPDGRFALSTHEDDPVMASHLSYSSKSNRISSSYSYSSGVHWLFYTFYKEAESMNLFELEEEGHEMLGDAALESEQVRLREWISWWASGDPRWVNVP